MQGANVDLHYDSGLKVIKAAGLLDAFKVNYMKGADKTRMVDKDGNVCFEEYNDEADNFDNEFFRPEIDRGVLRNVLLDSLLPGTVIWDSQFSDAKQVNGELELTFKNGTKVIADILIGADGYHSKIRPLVTDIKELYSGATFIQGEIEYPEKDCPEMLELVNQANLIAMGVGKTIAVQPSGNGSRLTFYTAAMLPEAWVKDSGIDFNNCEEVYDYLVKFYDGWNPLFLRLFKACKSFVPRPINYFPLDQNWEAHSNITLIGDAAHLMPPSGEGVNTAMLDALDLMECLTAEEFDDLQIAIGAYEKRMFERAAALAKEAINGIKDFASPSVESVEKLIQQFKH